jgi:hypothetical protein
METTSVIQQSESVNKSTRIRSVAYPSNTIEHCIALTSTIFKLFGNVFATRKAISEKTEISDSHLQTQLSSCVQYGLLELKSNEGYKHTLLFTKIYKPLPSEKKEDALLEAFKNPELYKSIIKNHNQETLTAIGLSIILFRNHKVSESASHLASKIFIENANGLGLLNEENIFSVDSGVSIAETIELSENNSNRGDQNKEHDTEVIYLPPSQNNNSETNNYNPGKKYNSPPIPVFVDDTGLVAEVYLPNGYNKAHILRIIKVLTAQVE